MAGNTEIIIKGPFWTAEASLVDNDGGARTVFLSHTARDGADRFIPGTKTVLCRVKKVTIHPQGQGSTPAYVWVRPEADGATDFQDQAELRELINRGALSHLVVQVNDDDRTQEFICVNGDISLDPLSPEDSESGNALDNLYKALPIHQPEPAELDELGKREDSAALPGAVTVHGSGVSIYGQVRLPWQEEEKISAPFQIARVFPDASIDGKPGGFRVAPEYERFSAQESENLIVAWKDLSGMLNPRFPLNSPPLPDSTSTPRWVTLEISNPWRVPRIYWQTNDWDGLADEDLALLYERGEFTLLISDQQAYDINTPPTSLARFLPETVSVERTAGDLEISINPQAGALQSAGLKYEAQVENGEWREDLTLVGQELAFDPVDTPRRLRQYQNLPIPEWTRTTTIEPALLWAFVPLADGWAQLPVPNLTEQIYLDAELAQQEDGAVETHSVLRGAVAWGNDQSPVLDAHPDESPWNLALTGAQDLTGTWKLKSRKLNDVSVQIFNPTVVINGLLWLSTGKPRSVDALPDLEDWVAGLTSVPLRTINPERDVFQPVITFPDFNLQLSTRPSTSNVPGSARLSGWSLEYAANSKLLTNLIAGRILPADIFNRWPALIWRRHPSMPMIQALPLTQSQAPPNYPSASRQLVPFALPTKEQTENGNTFYRPDKWKFTVQDENGAASWPILDQSTAGHILPDSNWQAEYDLSLVALSLPGIVLDPKSPMMTTVEDDNDEPMLPGLGLQYRFDLPYTDEIQALAQLSHATEDGATAPDAEPKPLTRELLAEHWRQLAEKANLASADAVAAFDRSGDDIVLKNLVEPFDWPVTTVFNLSAYPGRFELKNAGNGTGLTVGPQEEGDYNQEEGDYNNALEGISGSFKKNGDGTLELVEADGDFQITAGSMAALVDEQKGFRDQRGLQRGLSQKTTTIIRTPVQLEEAGGAEVSYDLVSLTVAHKLQLHAGVEWDLWFRDLPVTGGTFDRDEVQSNQVEDINDPQALARAQNYLNGYEWRLAQAGHEDRLTLFNLHFYPLSLKQVELNGDEVQRVEIIGRLQLPLAGSGEQTDFSNAVRVIFKVEDGGLALQQIAVEVPGDWPLSLDEGESGKAPHLLWGDIRLDEDGLKIVSPRLKFVLFDTVWTLPLSDLTFGPNLTRITSTFQFPDMPTLDPLHPEKVNLVLDLLPATPATSQHTVMLDLQIALGIERDQGLVPFRGQVRFSVLAAQEATPDVEWIDGMLFADVTEDGSLKGGLKLTLPKDVQTDPIILFNANALELRWPSYDNPQHTLQFLPGMPLQGTSDSQNEPGFACLTFEVEPGEEGIPSFSLKTAFVEALLACHWPNINNDAQPSADDRIFASSAGELTIGYTLAYTNEEWRSSVLLNGHLEITNLISWPLAMAKDPQAGSFKLPSLIDNLDLQHIRHKIRILFNQHFVPSNVLVIAGSEDVLYTVGEDKTWQLLAVVEHRLIDIGLEPNGSNNDRRWTALQEVRFLPQKTFDAFLDKLDKSSSPGVGVENYGYLNPMLRNLLVEELAELDGTSAEANLLFVEASALHWIRRNPVADAAPIPLQYLPSGTQLGILSGPEDYMPSDPKDPKWLLMTMPFLGRLQDDGAEDRDDCFLDDPVRQVKSQGATASALALAFTGWQTDQEISFTVSALDMPDSRSWPRLDPGALEENWFRLQHPRDEEFPSMLQSVTAALPNTSARLSRAMALRQASYAFRAFYPPSDLPSNLLLPPANKTGAVTWRQNSLLALEGVLRIADTASHSLWDASVTPDLDESSDSGFEKKTVELGVRFQSRVDGAITGLRFYKDEGMSGWHKGRLSDSEGAELGSAEFDNETASGWQTVTFPNPIPIKADTTYIASNSYLTAKGMIVSTRKYFEDNAGYANDPLKTLDDGNGVYRDEMNSSFTPDQQHRNFWVDVIFIPALTAGWQLSGAQLLASPALGPAHSDPTLRRYPAATLLPRPEEATGKVQNATQNSITLEAETAADTDDAYKGVQIQILAERGAEQVRVITAYNGTTKVATIDTNWSGIKPQKGSKYRIGAWPQSLAVSPYLGLDFKSSGNDLRLKLISVELLCQDRVTGLLRPVASQMWELGESETQRSLQPHIQHWASETHRRLTPESPVAILRFRKINENAASGKPTEAGEMESMLTTTYGFALVAGIKAGDNLVEKTFALRSAVKQLRFREGQFGGYTIPAQAEPFEIAPPQVNGVQPLYLTPEKNDAARDWPWGLSTLRINVQYTNGQRAVIGTAAKGASSMATLWWQALQHFVQFRQAGSGNDQTPEAGLPALFRAPAIKSLLPVLPNPPMPALQASTIFNFTDNNAIERWQPILPGALRYMTTGARVGVMFAMRHSIIKQSGLHLDRTPPQTGASMVSGSVPVQHRFPRPVPLPDNAVDKKETALKTWASYFEPTQTLLACETPIDEAFFARDTNEPARRLRLQLIEPLAITPDWNGTLRFSATSDPDSIDENQWEISVSIGDKEATFDIKNEKFTTASQEYQFEFGGDEATIADWRKHLSSKAPGAFLFVRAVVRFKREPDDGFSQTLSFPLRVIDPQALRLPLAPRFIHFEDPEYNRQLVSSAAQAAKPVVEEIRPPEGSTDAPIELEHSITLAADRKEYNPDSVLAFRFDWADTVEIEKRNGTASYSLKAIDGTGNVRIANIENEAIRDGILKRHSLLNLKLHDGRPLNLRPGDALEIELTVNPEDPFRHEKVVISLKLDIVREAVTPVSSSAYALLRRKGIADLSPVECVRFAWGPNASRVELVNPADLRTGVVRRRAVFQWTDSVRPGLKKDLLVQGEKAPGANGITLFADPELPQVSTAALVVDDSLYTYAIQKISPNGSTHVPKMGA